MAVALGPEPVVSGALVGRPFVGGPSERILPIAAAASVPLSKVVVSFPVARTMRGPTSTQKLAIYFIPSFF